MTYEVIPSPGVHIHTLFHEAAFAFGKYSWSVDSTGLNCISSLIWGCFSINQQWILRIPRFCIFRFNQPGIENSIFDPRLGINPWMWRAGCMHCSMPFHVWVLSICRFWYPLGHLEASPWGYWGKTAGKFLGSQKLYMEFQLHEKWVPLTLQSSRVNYVCVCVCVYI